MDSQGSVWLSGYTESKDLPLKNAAQSMLGGPIDCFLAKVSSSGALLVSTYWGGSALDTCWGIAVDAQDNVYIGGGSTSDDFPFKDAIQTTHSPRTGFTSPTLAKFSPTGQVAFSTFLGNGSWGGVFGIGFDVAGNVYITGDVGDAKLVTTPNAFQTTAGGNQDAIVIKLNPNGSQVLYSTYLGGSNIDSGRDIKVDTNGYIYVYGYTSSSDFPLKDSLRCCQVKLFGTSLG